MAAAQDPGCAVSGGFRTRWIPEDIVIPSPRTGHGAHHLSDQPAKGACHRAATTIALLLALSGCSVEQLAVRRAGDALATSGDLFATDDDPELVAAAAPFGLKTVEGLAAKQPDHAGLRLAAARGFTQYAWAFVQSPADELEERDLAGAYALRARAQRLYLRARNHGLAGLGFGTNESLARLRADPSAALARVGRDRAALLHWTAVAWAAAISLGKDNPALVADLPVVEALVHRAMATDPGTGDGALHTFLISYEAARPAGGPAAMALARRHFDVAIARSGGLDAAPRVALAEAVARTGSGRAEFESLLRDALAVDPDRAPSRRLANLVSQRRARWLLTQTDNLFPE
jgi:predicted anti-sigma-YlaC factor YlaD